MRLSPIYTAEDMSPTRPVLGSQTVLKRDGQFLSTIQDEADKEDDVTTNGISPDAKSFSNFQITPNTIKSKS